MPSRQADRRRVSAPGLKQVQGAALPAAPGRFLIPYADRLIIYQPLKPLAFVGNPALARLLDELAQEPDSGSYLELAGDAAQWLRAIGALAPDPEPPRLPQTQAFLPTKAVLLLTNACNLRCAYCYASAGQGTPRQLDPDVGRAAIDLANAHAGERGQDQFSLDFHGGGEPTQAWPLLKELTRYARRRSLPCAISLTSNGCWTADQRRWVLENMDSVSLSWDGLDQVQDRQRPRASGRGSGRAVWRSLEALDQRGLPFGLRLTVTDYSLPWLEESVAMACGRTGCRTMQVEPAFPQGRALESDAALTRSDDFARAFLAAHDLALDQGRHLYYSGARPWQLTARFCRAPEEALIVGHQGWVTACYEVWSPEHPLAGRFGLGRLDPEGGLVLSLAARTAFLHRLEERRRLCRDCFCYWHCAGDCPSKTFTPTGDGHLNFGPRCDLNRHLTRELLVRYIAANDGLWRGELPPSLAQHPAQEETRV